MALICVRKVCFPNLTHQHITPTSYPTSKRLYYPTSKRLYQLNQTYKNINKRLLWPALVVQMHTQPRGGGSYLIFVRGYASSGSARFRVLLWSAQKWTDRRTDRQFRKEYVARMTCLLPHHFIYIGSPPKFVTLLAIHGPSYKTTVAPNIYITACYGTP